jgi:hypothetical protein
MASRCIDYGARVDTNNYRYYVSSKRDNFKRRRKDLETNRLQVRNYILNEKGQSILETLIALPLIVFIIFAAVQYWGVLTLYLQAEYLKHRTLARMEVDGGLTELEKNKLIDSLLRLGADQDSIHFNFSNDLEEQTTFANPPVPRPGRVILSMGFVPEKFNIFSAQLLMGQPGKPVVIRVRGESTSEFIGN